METEITTSVTIREATDQDIPAIESFIKPFVDERKLLPRTYDELEDFADNFFVAELDGEIVGCAALDVYSKKLAEVRSLAVSSTLQGKGVGKQLVRACAHRARQLDILEVMAITSSEAFFKACGFDFTATGEKKALFLQTQDKL